MRTFASGTGLALSLLWLACHGNAPAAQEPTTRATMEQIADALSKTLPLSLDAQQLEDPAARARYGASLGVLADRAAGLERHGRSRDAGFAYLSRSLAHDARTAKRRFEQGHDVESQFVVRQLVQDCVACHSRLPDLDDSELGARLLAQLDLDELPLFERVRVQAATRQFDAALDGYEELFRDPEISPAQLDLEGRILEYLTITIRVKQDLRRPRWSLERMAQRPDVPDYLTEDLAAWYTTLEALADQPRLGNSGATARALVQDAHLEEMPAYDRRGYVYALMASSLLHQHLNAATLSEGELAEAYYLLGLTETRASRSLWLSEADVYLETSVRSAPGSPDAAKAYELLEQETLAGYTGSAGLQLPDDVAGRLLELRLLIDAASAPPASSRP